MSSMLLEALLLMCELLKILNMLQDITNNNNK